LVLLDRRDLRADVAAFEEAAAQAADDYWRALVPAHEPPDPLRCPSCQSPSPRLHPAVSGGGEVTKICIDAFHGDTPHEPPALAMVSGEIPERPPPVVHETAGAGPSHRELGARWLAEHHEQLRPGVVPLAPWVAEELGHLTVDAAVDSIVARARAS
jgi:hypothetical protein